MSNPRPKTRAIIEDPKIIRQAVQDKVVQSLRRKFPIESRNYRADISNLDVKSVAQSPQQQKLTLLGKGNISDTVYADLEVSEISSGKTILKIPHHRIMNYPRFTNRYTMMVDGNEYNIVNQLRTKSGVYTRTRGNGELESSFNLESGANFKLVMNPETGVFKVDILHSVIPMAAILKILNCPPVAVEKALGPDLYAVNREASPAQFNRAVNTLYDKLVKYKSQLGDTASVQEKIQAIRQYFSSTKIDSETTQITLGKEHTSVGYQTILDAASKVVRVHKGEEPQDARDNLEFQKVFSVEDFLGEALEKSTSEITKIKAKLGAFKPSGDQAQDKKAIKAIFSPVYFSRPVRNFVTTSSISRLPSQINPMEIMDGSTIVTRLGEGAISSEQAVPDETRDVNLSYMGTIDPIATPESGKIGIDNRFSIGAIKGEDNELYKRVTNTRTGKGEVHRLIDLRDKVLGFPDPPHKKDPSPEDVVPASHKGELVHVKRSELDFQIPTVHDISTVTTNTLPFINANQGNRVVMGAKHVQQALPLKYRDRRLVEAVMPSLNTNVSKTLNDSTLGTIGGYLIPKAPISGEVIRISDSTIQIRGTDGKVEQVHYDNHLPLASKTMLNNTLLVKPGDTVKKGQPLAESNFTKDGTLALGKNLSVAYMPYHGQNHEDGIVISEGASKKLTSMHAEKITIPLDKLSVLDKETFATYFPTLFSKAQLSKLDADGIVQKGAVLETGDPIAVVLENSGDSKRNQVLGKLHKALVSKYRDVSQIYEQAYPATVVEVVKTRKLITILLEMEKPAGLGDKLSGSYGNKGVITKIIPDDQMVKDEQGNPIDTVFTSAGVIGRINPAQTLESALGKVATKTGKPYAIENYGVNDYTEFVDGELKKHGVSDKETLFDPITEKKIPGVFTGVQHVHKLFKTTDSNFSGRGVDGPHDQDDTPTGSGDAGPKALGGMEVNALIAHGSRNLLRESTMLRASKNRDFWQAFQEGSIAHMPKEKKTFTKLVGLMRQAGIKVEKKGDDLIAGPLTDKDALEMSNGEVTEATELAAKNMMPEKNGLFDERITGGLDGEKWSHITLAEPVLNPIFEDGAKSLLGVSTKDLHSMYREKGGDFVREKLNSLDLNQELTETRKSLDDPKVKGDALDNRVKRMKYLKALHERDLKAGDAYTLKHVPVLPPKLRPITVGKTGDIMSNDSNSLYKDLIAQNNAFKKTHQAGMSELLPENRDAIYSRVRELTGVMAPGSAQHKAKGTKGAVQFISGDVPKHGYFQRKAIYSKMNMSGRATIAPDNTLGLDEIGVPVEMAWSMYSPFVIRKLVQLGHTAVSAKEAVAERSDLATKILHEELEKRPMITNRAPTLWKHSLLGVKPVLRTGKNLMVNSLWESSLNADYDGDCSINSVYYRSRKDLDKSAFSFKYSPETTTQEDNMAHSGRIRNTQGLINLSEFPRVEDSAEVRGNKTVYSVPEGVEVLTSRDGVTQWLPVDKFHIHRDLDMVEVRSHTSRTIHCSTDHSLVTLDDNLEYTKAAPRQGMFIPRLREPVQGGGVQEIPSTYRLHCVAHLRGNIRLTRDFGYLMGCFIGDGWVNGPLYDQSVVYLANNSEEVRNKFVACAQALVETGDLIHSTIDSPHEYDGSQCSSTKLRIYSQELAQLFRDYVGHGAGNKHLPYYWVESPRDFRLGLLAGLIDTDGTVSLCKAKSKRKTQTIVSYTTTSRVLAFELVGLAHSLDMDATATFSKMTNAGNETWNVSFTSRSVQKIQQAVALFEPRKKEALSTAEAANVKYIWDFAPPLPQDRIIELRKALGTGAGKTGNELKQHTSLYSILYQVSKGTKQGIGKDAARRIISTIPDFFLEGFWAKWKGMVEDNAIVWERIQSVTPVPEITEAYDLTIPPAYTMVTEAGFIIYDTMQVHVPITEEAIEDVKKIMPSKLIYSDKKKGDLLIAPSHEPIVGLFKVTRNLGMQERKPVHKFANVEEAWKAYYAGKLKATDYVDIGG